MSSATLYGVGLSQPTRSCLMLIKEANLPVAFEVVNLLAGDHKKEPYISINPAGQLPAYVEGDFKLAEGAAILAYLAEAHNLTKWYPTDPKARAKVNQWLHWNHTNTRKSSHGIFGPILFGGTVDTSGLEKALAVLESRLAGGKFVASEDHPTIADLMVLPELDQLSAEFHGEDHFDFTPYPNVTRYVADLSAAVPSYAQNKADAVAILAMIKAPK